MEKSIISSEQFIKFWKKGFIKDKQKNEVYIDDDSSKSKKTLRFENIIFEEKIKIENIDDELMALRFVNCSIKELVINNCKTDFIQFQNNTEIGQLNIGDNSDTRFISFDKSTSKNGINIWTNSICEGIHIFESDIKGVLIEDKETNVGHIQAENSKIGTLFCNNGSNLTIIELINCKVNIFEFIGKSNIEFINIENSLIQKFNAKNSYIDLYINFIDSSINYFNLQVNNLPELNFKNSFIQSIVYKNIISSSFNLRNCKIVDFIFEEMKTGKDGLVQLIDCEIANLTFDKMINLSSFNISNLKPLKEASIFKFTIYPKSNFKRGEDMFELVEKNGFETNISFISSDLGKMLISSDLSKFDNFIFANSKISEIFIAGPKLPKIKTIESEKENLILQQRIAYNQIKKIYENRGDAITPLKFFRDEMDAYRLQTVIDTEKKSVSEKFQLNFNKYTNSHGTNWIKPLFWTLSLSIFFYLIYCWLLFGFTSSIDFNLIPYYFEFLNPTHKINFIKEFDVHKNTIFENIALFIDFLNRILVPLLVYQMIQAFRMYGKK